MSAFSGITLRTSTLGSIVIPFYSCNQSDLMGICSVGDTLRPHPHLNVCKRRLRKDPRDVGRWLTTRHWYCLHYLDPKNTLLNVIWDIPMMNLMFCLPFTDTIDTRENLGYRYVEFVGVNNCYPISWSVNGNYYFKLISVDKYPYNTFLTQYSFRLS